MKRETLEQAQDLNNQIRLKQQTVREINIVTAPHVKRFFLQISEFANTNQRTILHVPESHVEKFRALLIEIKQLQEELIQHLESQLEAL